MTMICVAVLMRQVLTSISPSTDAEQPRVELGDGTSFHTVSSGFACFGIVSRVSFCDRFFQLSVLQ